MSYQDDFNEQEGQEAEAPDIGTLAVLNKSEIDQQIATARRYPRSIKKFRDEARQLATLDERTADECIYALPRKAKDKDTGKWVLKTIEGPSARFAEIVNYAWGNTRAGARTIGEDENFVKSQGVFYDLEKNTAISYEVSRSIVDSNGNRYKQDMIGTTSNAAASIALRNAILKGVPKAFWSPIYEEARKVVAGDVRTLANRRLEAIKSFAIFGVTPDMIYATLGVGGAEDITIERLVTLKGLLTAIQGGDTTPEQAFSISAKQPLPTEIKRKSTSVNGNQVGNTVTASAPASPEASVDPPEPLEAPSIPPAAQPTLGDLFQASTKPEDPRQGLNVKGVPLSFTGK